jgi:hypothetical protein
MIATVYVRQELVTPIALVTAGRPQTVQTPASEDAIIAAVELKIHTHVILHVNWDYLK